jgi:hypothetical protein
MWTRKLSLGRWFVIALLCLVLGFGFAAFILRGSDKDQGPEFSITCLGTGPMGGIAAAPAELTTVTFFCLSNASSQRWLVRTKAIVYAAGAGLVTNRTWGVAPVVPVEGQFVLAAGQAKKLYVPDIVTNHSLQVWIECQGKATGARGQINDFFDRRDNLNNTRPGMSYETFSGGSRHALELREATHPLE